MNHLFYKFFGILITGALLAFSSACTMSGLNDFSQARDFGKTSIPDPGYQVRAETKLRPVAQPAEVHDPGSLSHDLFKRVNAYRKSLGLPALRWNKEMAALAEAHSRNMAAKCELNHKGFNKRLKTLRRGGFITASENVAYYKGRSDPASIAMQLWIDSPGHQRNLAEASHTTTGVGGAINSQGYVYFSQLYGR